ncbi:MAG TPA: hypothetical protein VIU93_15420 [Gallionellaceae bacterium]
MKNGIRLLKCGAELGMFALMVGILMAGCGGGGGGGGGGSTGTGTSGGTPWWTVGTTPSAGGTAVASYIAGEMSGSFGGKWWVGNWFGSTPAASATALTETLAGTAQPTVFNVTKNQQALINGAWSNLTVSSGSSYNLTPNGWALSTNDMLGSTFVDSGNGSDAALVLANGAAYTYAITRTNLAGSPVVCPGTCTTPGAYPAGAESYSLAYTSNFYFLYNLSNGLQVTDGNGAALTSLPVEDVTTFCDPLIGAVYVHTHTQMSANPNGWLYYVYFLTPGSACTSGNISTALAAGAQQQVTITWTPTGVAAVPTVLVLTNWFPIYPNMSSYGFTNPWFYSLRAGYVWEGLMLPAATSGSSMKNKAAINAELNASGYTAIP